MIDHPGCFGSPTAVSVSCASCRVCPSRASCAIEAFSLLESLPDTPETRRERQSLTLTRTAFTGTPRSGAGVTVTATPSGRAKVILSAELAAQIALLPAKVASQVRRLTEAGWFVFAREELARGRNPATKSWRKVFCSQLLDGGATRAELELALVEQLGVSRPSAKVQVSVGMSVFAFGRVATEKFGHFSMSHN